MITALRGHTSAVTSLACNKSNDIIVSGDQNGIVHVWKDVLKVRRSVKQFQTVKEQVKTKFSNPFMTLNLVWLDESNFLSQNRHCTLTQYDITRNEPVHAIQYSQEIIQTSFTRMALNSDHTFCALPSEKQISLYSTRNLTTDPPVTFPLENKDAMGFLMGLCFHRSKDNELYGAFENGQVLRWDIRNPDQPGELVKKSQEHSPVLSIKNCNIRDDSSWDCLTLSHTDNRISFTMLNHQDSAASQLQLKNEGISDLLFTTNGRIMCTAGWDHRVRIFEMKKNKDFAVNCKPIAVYKGHTATVNCLDTTRDESMLISGGNDERLYLWSLNFSHKQKA